MNENFEKRLDFDSDTFEQMKQDMNFVLQRLIGNMQEKGTDEGSMTLKIDITMVRTAIANYDPNVEGKMREISKPSFKHKVTSAVKINDEKSGIFNNELELVMDKDTGVFKLVPIANTTQRSIFDSDFQEPECDESIFGNNDGDEDSDYGTKMIDGTYRPLLPGPEDDQGKSENGMDGLEDGEDLEDITDDLLSTGSDNSYNYDDPDDDDDDSEE